MEKKYAFFPSWRATGDLSVNTIAFGILLRTYYEDSNLRTVLRGGSKNFFRCHFLVRAPISCKLDFWASWDITNHVRNLFHSKIPLHLRDRGRGSKKPSIFHDFGRFSSQIPYVIYIGNLRKIQHFQLPTPLSPRWSGIFEWHKFLTCALMSQKAQKWGLERMWYQYQQEIPNMKKFLFFWTEYAGYPWFSWGPKIWQRCIAS